MPFGGPGELAEAGDAACFGHARQTEIEPVGKEARHQDLRVAGQARLTPYEKPTPRRRSLNVQSTIQKITDIELTSERA